MMCTTISRPSSVTRPRLLSFEDSLWHKSTPAAVRHADGWDEGSDGWVAWHGYLATRSSPPPLSELLPGKWSPLVWSIVPDDRSPETWPLLNRLAKVRPGKRTHKKADSQWTKEVEVWLADAAGEPPTSNLALEHLAFCHALAPLAGRLPAALWWELTDYLYQQATAPLSETPGDHGPLVRQLFAGELPLSLAYVLGELEPCRSLISVAREVLSTGLVDLLDGQGLPHATRLHLLRPLFGCWTRAAALAGKWKKGCFSSEARNQYEWLVRQAMRLSRHDGSQILSRDAEAPWSAALFNAALHFGGDADDHEIARLALPKGKSPNGRPPKLPDAAEQSGWSELAVLRSDWQRSANLLGVTYAGEQVHGELQSGVQRFLAGTWELDLRADGRPAPMIQPWEEVCWFSDNDGVYLELEAELEGSFAVQRQILLAREDRFLLLADAIVGKRKADLDYRLTLPLATDVKFRPADETREGWLIGQSRRALVLPLALPEWRCDPREGRLSGGTDGLSLVQSRHGHALYSVLWIDLDPRRQSQRYTWRHLTVAEQLAIVPRDVAAGFRVQIGKRQWLIYRALTSKGNRTILGQNLTSEFLVARFDREGEVDEIVEIE